MSDTSEHGLESLIFAALTGLPTGAGDGRGVAERAAPYAGAGYVPGDPRDYDRDHAVDLAKLLAFLRQTQPRAFEQLELASEGPPRLKFLARLQGEIAKRGVVDVLRKGIQHGPASVDLFCGTPSPGNARAAALFAANLFSVTRQLQYSRDETQLALDLALFINGLPVATFELKNRLTKQTVADAEQQYRRDRDPRELLFQADQEAAIEPVPPSGGGRTPEPELDRLSNIVRAFNDQFGNIDWRDVDKIHNVIAQEIPARVAADRAYQNAMQHSDEQNARLEHDQALQRVLVDLLKDHTELFKQYSDNPAFKKWLAETVFAATYVPPAG